MSAAAMRSRYKTEASLEIEASLEARVVSGALELVLSDALHWSGALELVLSDAMDLSEFLDLSDVCAPS